MRCKKISYTFSALDADGFAAAVTGAIHTTPWTTILGYPLDGCAHLGTLTLASGGSLAAVTITVAGTNAEGKAITEAIAGPSATTTMTKYFKTVTSITADGTLGASTMNVGWSAVAVTPAYPVAIYPHDGPLVGCEVGGTINYTVQQTNDNIFDNTVTLWTTLQAAGTSNTLNQALIGVTALRVLVNSHTSGTLKVTTTQARA